MYTQRGTYFQSCVLGVFTLGLVACGGNDVEAPPKPQPVNLTSINLNTDNDALVSGQFVDMSLQLNRALESEQKLTVEWRVAGDQSVLSSDQITLAQGTTSYSTSLTVPQLSSERYDLVLSTQVHASLNTSELSSEEVATYASAPAEKLLNSNGYKWATEQQAERVWQDGEFQVISADFDLWSIPEDPTWREDPYDNNTWLLYYHSLGWLYALDHAYETSGNDEILERMEFLLLDYLSDNPRGGDNNYMAWSDHAVAWRLETLVYLYQKHFRSLWSNQQKLDVSNKLLDHADELESLLQDERYFAHNHSMYHAMSLYNFSFVFPVENEKHVYREKAMERINELFDEMVNNETGVSVEQSTSYHFIAMELFIDANRLAQTLTSEPMATLAENLSKMADFGAHFIYRNGLATAMGDTNFDRPIWWDRLKRIVEQGNIQSSYVDHVLTDGESGQLLMENYVAASDGYAIQRPSYTLGGDEVYTFTDFGKKLFSHGHHDAGNVVAALNGEQILIDIGGPYLYNSPKREYFRSAYAHNTLIVNEQSVFANDAILLSANCAEGLCYSLGKIQEATYNHWRIVVTQQTENGPRWVIGDLARPSTDVDEMSEHQFKLVYHLAETASVDVVNDSQSCQAITLASGENFCLHVKASQPQEIRFYSGMDDENYTQGWVQPAFGQRRPAPVLEFVSAGSTLNAISELRSERIAPQPLGQLQAINEAALTYSLELGSHTLLLSDLASASPSVSITAHY